MRLLVFIPTGSWSTSVQIPFTRIGNVVARSTKKRLAHARHRCPGASYQGTGRRAECDSKSEAEHEGQDPVPDDRPEDKQHKKWNEDGHSVFGDHRLKQFSRESRACTWTATMAII
jgi:hypothetical protein